LARALIFQRLRSSGPVERVEPAADVAEVDGIVGHKCRAKDTFRRRLKADFSVRREQALASRRVPIGPADLAIGRQLVEGRVGGRPEVDISPNDDGRGMNDADLLVRPLGGEAPFLFEPASVVLADCRLGGLYRVPITSRLYIAQSFGLA